MREQTARTHSRPVYRVVVTDVAEHAEGQIRELIQRKGGDLRLLFRSPPREPSRIHIHLGLRRIDDVLAALEGAGFAICAQGRVSIAEHSQENSRGE